MSKEGIEANLIQGIQDRRRTWSSHKNYSTDGSLNRMPEVSLPQAVNTFLESPSVWLNVDGVDYTPSVLIKSFIIRKDGCDLDEKQFSVFIADSKRSIAKNWGIVPRSSWNKQKFQYWDKRFVTALFTRIVSLIESPDGLLNKTAYKIREDVGLGEIEKKFNRANKAFLDILNKQNQRTDVI